MTRRRILSPDFPFSPRRLRVHYGWVIPFVAIFAFWASIPGHSLGINVFTEKLIQALQLSRSDISACFFIGTLASALLLPKVGSMFDRWGARTLSMIAGLLLALTLIYLSFIDGVAAFLEKNSPIEIPGNWIRLAVLSLGFFAIRICGDGTLAFCARNMISKWWERRRGRILSSVGIFASLSYSVAPQVFNACIESLGWRESWRLFAVLIGTGFTFIAWLTFRDSPQSCGLTSDAGLKAPTEEESNPEFILRKEFTRGEALRQYAFWCFSLVFFGHSCFYTGYVFHVVDVSASLELEKESMLSLFFPAALLAGAVNLGSGWASDHVCLKWILLFMSVASAIGSLSLALGTGLALKVGFVIGFGMSIGCFVTLSTAFVARFFGLKHLGAISGMLTSMILLGGAIGPLLFSLFRDWLGGYREVSLFTTVGFGLIALGSLWANNPQRALKA